MVFKIINENHFDIQGHCDLTFDLDDQSTCEI